MNKKLNPKGIIYTQPSLDLLKNPDTRLLYNIQEQAYRKQEEHQLYKLTNSKSNSNTSESSVFNSNSSTNNLSINSLSTSKSTIINVVSTIRDLDSNKNIVDRYKNKELLKHIDLNDYVNFALYLKKKDFISIPKKVVSAVKYISETRLKNIHPDLEVARELCLIFISLLTSTYFEMLDGSDGWKPLHSSYLRDLFKGVADYKNIKLALEQPLRKCSIVECDNTSIINEKCFYYRLGDSYIKKGIESYQLQTEIAKKTYADYQLLQLALSDQNAICKNLFEFYKHIELPTIEMVKEEAKRLVDNKYITKKGKLLRFRNKHGNGYFKDAEKLAFIEDHIKLFEYLTENGLLRPNPTSAENGHRVVDSLTLMPSWIRQLLKYKGKQLIEIDYSCLHPNAAMSLYGGKMEYLTHSQLCDETELQVKSVKLEHLSFFNKEVRQMKQSPLWDYYNKNEHEMLNRIVHEKLTDRYGHKITSMRLFKKEVEIMTDVILRLNQESIYVGYVYDALLCEPKDAEKVKQIMDATILEHNVKTVAKLESLKSPMNVDQGLNIAPIEIDVDFISDSFSLRDDVRESLERGKELKVIEALIVFAGSRKYRKNVVKVFDRFQKKEKYILESFIFEDGWNVHKKVH